MNQASELTREIVDQDPSLNSLWQQLKRPRLTSSLFSVVVKHCKKF